VRKVTLIAGNGIGPEVTRAAHDDRGDRRNAGKAIATESTENND
jgi:hypothetical protein